MTSATVVCGVGFPVVFPHAVRQCPQQNIWTGNLRVHDGMILKWQKCVISPFRWGHHGDTLCHDPTITAEKLSHTCELSGSAQSCKFPKAVWKHKQQPISAQLNKFYYLICTAIEIVSVETWALLWPIQYNDEVTKFFYWLPDVTHLLLLPIQTPPVAAMQMTSQWQNGRRHKGGGESTDTGDERCIYGSSVLMM